MLMLMLLHAFCVYVKSPSPAVKINWCLKALLQQKKLIDVSANIKESTTQMTTKFRGGTLMFKWSLSTGMPEQERHRLAELGYID